MRFSDFYFVSIRRVLSEFDRLIMLGDFLEKNAKLSYTKTILKDTIELLGRINIELKEGLDKIEKENL